MKLFRELNSKEELKFRQWARENYKPFDDIKGSWHPVVVTECAKINQEAHFINDAALEVLEDEFFEEGGPLVREID